MGYKYLETKDLDGGATLDVDDSSRRVKVAIAGFENLDRDQDIIVNTAANRTIKERGPSGTKEIWHLIDHAYTLRSALGKFNELYVGTSGEELNKLIGVNDIAKTRLGDDIWEHYKNGSINQHSITFTTISASPAEMKVGDNIVKYRRIDEIAVWEGSAVLWGANPATPTLTVGKSVEQITLEVTDKLAILEKCMRTGKYSDEFFSLIELQIKSIKQYIADLEIKANQPAVMAIDTVVVSDDSIKNAELNTANNAELNRFITNAFKL